MATRRPADHSWISWRVHAVWAVLVLVPFLGPQMALGLGGDSERVATTLAFYGPAIAVVWLAGHATIVHVQRERHQRSLALSAVTP